MKKCLFYKKLLSTIVVLGQAVFVFAQEGLIKGRVSNGNEYLQGATVSLGDKTMLTNNEGKFSFSIKAGSYTLLSTYAGYKKIWKEVKIEAGNTQVVDFILVPDDQLGEVTVLGSRSLVQRSNLNTAVPVDVFTSQQLVQTGQMTLTQMLNYSAPSFNASRPHNNEPATLRGLNPDHLLILVNGTRRHSMAIITTTGARGQLGGGTAPNDLNSIPFTAIEKIEILRDGAAAQYGSDAIAGVMNIQLKKSTGKTTIQMQTGQFFKGDGENIIAGINHGFSLNNKGFLNFSADFRFNDYTYRGGTFTGTVYKTIPNNATPAVAQTLRAQDDSLVSVNNFDRRFSQAGSPKITRIGALLNGGYEIGKKTELFWTAAVSSRQSRALQGYALPKNPNRINTLIFPNGFQSINRHRPIDISGIAGAKGETTNGWRWELTSAYGNSTDRYQLENGNNATQFYTLGKDAPTSFYYGTLIYSQLTNNLQFSKSLSSNPGKSSDISLGAEWRLEHYQIKPGEESAYTNYDPQARKQVSFGGWAPENVVNKSRNVGAAYMDFETEIARRFLVDMAARYENYSDFGGNLAGKISARYKLSERVAIRGSVNNGFRAPSLPQRYYTVLGRNVSNRGGVLINSISALFRNDSPQAQAFGIPNLTAERSVNVSGGITAALSKTIRMTVDAYWIQIKNRIVASGRFDTTNNPVVREILRPFPEVTSAQFFVNAINTKTKGVDVVLNGNWKINKANFLATLAANFTQTRLFGDIKAAGKLPADSLNTNTLFNREERARMELGQPDSKIVFSLNYKTNKFGVLVRNTRFGETGTRFNFPAFNPDENFSSKILTDLSLSYTPKSWLTFTAGANNILDVYPDRIQDVRNTQEGTLIYSLEATPFGFYGGYYFVGLAIQLQNH